MRESDGVWEGERDMERVMEAVGEPELEREVDTVALSEREVETVAVRHSVEVGETEKEGEGVCEGEGLPLREERAEAEAACARRRAGGGSGGCGGGWGTMGGRGSVGAMGVRRVRGTRGSRGTPTESDVAGGVSSRAIGAGWAPWPSKWAPCAKAVAARAAMAASAHRRCRAVPILGGAKGSARHKIVHIRFFVHCALRTVHVCTRLLGAKTTGNWPVPHGAHAARPPRR